MYYIIQVQTGKEEEMISNIKRQLENIKQAEFDVFAPYRLENRKYRGVYKEVKVRCFPGYLFVETTAPYKLFEALYETPGFTKMLGREGHTKNFLPLNEDESRMIDILYSKNNDRITQISDIEVHEGDTIVVLDGPLMGQEAKIVDVDLHKHMVTIGWTMAHRHVEAKLGINIITNVNNKNK